MTQRVMTGAHILTIPNPIAPPPFISFRPLVLPPTHPPHFMKASGLDLFIKIAEKLPKNPVIPERESFPIVPPKGAKDKKGCC